MPIKWSAVKVREAMAMAEEFVKEADLPLFQAKIVATEARNIANLPLYIHGRLVCLYHSISAFLRKLSKSCRRNLLSPRGPMRYDFTNPSLLQRLTVLKCTPRSRAASLVLSITLESRFGFCSLGFPMTICLTRSRVTPNRCPIAA